MRQITKREPHEKVFSLLLVLVMVLSIAVPGMAAGKAKTKITLNLKGTVPVSMNIRLQLTATVTPEATVTWKSSKPSVATVKDGLVTPHKEGKATITAKAGGKTLYHGDDSLDTFSEKYLKT